jgi:lysophospholipase L1-like esterase
MRLAHTLLLLGLAASALADQPKGPKPKPTTHDYAKWEKSIAAFEAADKAKPPVKGSVLFVGSSTIVRWKSLAQDFPELPVLNRGFGGNQIKDSTHYAERMIFPYEPRMIVLRAGGNDINAGWPAADVFADFKAFVAKVRARLPQVPILYLGLSPTIKRWDQVAEGNKLNDLIANYCKSDPLTRIAEMRELTLDASGQPIPSLFVEDRLHLSVEGYKLLTSKVRPYVINP